MSKKEITNRLRVLLSEAEEPATRKIFTAKQVAEYIYSSLSDEQKEGNDWGLAEYYNTVKSFGKTYELIVINPNQLIFNEDFDADTIVQYEYDIENGKQLKPVVIDGENKLIDGNHRAKASLNMNKNISAYKPISK